MAKQRQRAQPQRSANPPTRSLVAAFKLYNAGELGQALRMLESLKHQERMNPDLHNLRGVVLARLGRQQEAEKYFLFARQLRPTQMDFLANLANVQRDLGRHAEALGNYDIVLRHAPQHVDAMLNRAMTLLAMDRVEDAIVASESLLKTFPDHAQATFNLATMLQHELRFEDALRLYRRVLELQPSHTGALANLLFVQHFLTPQDPAAIARLARELGHRYEATLHGRRYAHWNNDADPERRLRIGLLSSDLRDHPVGFFMEGLLDQPASRNVDWIGFHNHRESTALTQRMRRHFVAWHEVKAWSDHALLETIRNEQVDVLIDLTGHTEGSRISVFAAKPAPLQLSWLGYFGTTGLSTMDGVIADPVCLPPSEEGFFTEKVFRLPRIRYCFTPPNDAPAVGPLPASVRGYITFGCNQELAKINDDVLALWRRIADRAPNARWRIQSGRLSRPGQTERMKRRLEAHGLADRVALHGQSSRPDYLLAHAEVDLILDTFPYPGGTTTAEALWMGVPTLTLALPGMLGRQGEAINRAVAMPEWIVLDKDQYVAQAVYWAQPEQWGVLAELRAGLRMKVSAEPLFDQARFAKDWHALVRAAWQEACVRGWPKDADARPHD